LQAVDPPVSIGAADWRVFSELSSPGFFAALIDIQFLLVVDRLVVRYGWIRRLEPRRSNRPSQNRNLFVENGIIEIEMSKIGTTYWEGGKVKLGNLELNSLSVDELWKLHEEVGAVLSERILAEKRGLEERLARLNRAMVDKSKIPGTVSKTGQRRTLRRKYPPVLPKYRNPNNPSETWAGRGKQPRWLVSQLKAGKKMSDFLIGRAGRRSANKLRSA
jgi:DNA-binding protein H-NS